MVAGTFSAAKMGTVEPLAPIPIPRRRRQMKNSRDVSQILKSRARKTRHTVPVLGHSRSNDREETEDSREEDGTATTEEIVQRVRH
jgi:hypothetical protein